MAKALQKRTRVAKKITEQLSILFLTGTEMHNNRCLLLNDFFLQSRTKQFPAGNTWRLAMLLDIRSAVHRVSVALLENRQVYHYDVESILQVL